MYIKPAYKEEVSIRRGNVELSFEQSSMNSDSPHIVIFDGKNYHWKSIVTNLEFGTVDYIKSINAKLKEDYAESYHAYLDSTAIQIVINKSEYSDSSLATDCQYSLGGGYKIAEYEAEELADIVERASYRVTPIEGDELVALLHYGKRAYYQGCAPGNLRKEAYDDPTKPFIRVMNGAYVLNNGIRYRDNAVSGESYTVEIISGEFKQWVGNMRERGGEWELTTNASTVTTQSMPKALEVYLLKLFTSKDKIKDFCWND